MSTADELIKLKELLDSGALTQEEYDGEKKKLLQPVEPEPRIEPVQNVRPEPVLRTAPPTESPRQYKGCLITLVVFLVLSALFGFFSILSQDVPRQEVTSSDPLTRIEQTVSQKSALQSAKRYLIVAPFSAQGLRTQLEFEGFSTEDATYAVEHCGADWNEQAAKSAKLYMTIGGFSKRGLQQQLEIGDQFTPEQAAYGVQSMGY